MAAAIALPPEGKVIACDVSEEYTREARKNWVQAEVANKIDLIIAPATETLQKLIEQGESGTYDFAFVDADKGGYVAYYELCMQLLRPGGVIAFDNTLWSGRILKPDDKCDGATLALKQVNDHVVKDSGRSYVVQLNIGDGYTIAVKL